MDRPRGQTWWTGGVDRPRGQAEGTGQWDRLEIWVGGCGGDISVGEPRKKGAAGGTHIGEPTEPVPLGGLGAQRPLPSQVINSTGGCGWHGLGRVPSGSGCALRGFPFWRDHKWVGWLAPWTASEGVGSTYSALLTLATRKGIQAYDSGPESSPAWCRVPVGMKNAGAWSPAHLWGGPPCSLKSWAQGAKVLLSPPTWSPVPSTLPLCLLPGSMDRTSPEWPPEVPQTLSAPTAPCRPPQHPAWSRAAASRSWEEAMGLMDPFHR